MEQVVPGNVMASYQDERHRVFYFALVESIIDFLSGGNDDVYFGDNS